MRSSKSSDKLKFRTVAPESSDVRITIPNIKQNQLEVLHFFSDKKDPADERTDPYAKPCASWIPVAVERHVVCFEDIISQEKWKETVLGGPVQSRGLLVVIGILFLFYLYDDSNTTKTKKKTHCVLWNAWSRRRPRSSHPGTRNGDWWIPCFSLSFLLSSLYSRLFNIKFTLKDQCSSRK